MQDISRAEIESRLKEILVSRLLVDAAVVAQSDARTPLLGRGVGIDSVETLAFAAGIEQEFDLQIPDTHLTVERFRTLGALADYIEMRLAARERGST